MKVSLVIPTLKKNQPYLDLCLDSFQKNTRSFEFEVLIGENEEGKNQGQCTATNRESYRSSGDWLLISNDDMYYAPGWDKNINFNISDCFCPNLVEPTDNPGSAPPFLKVAGGYTIDSFQQDAVDKFVAEQDDSVIERGFNMPIFIKKSLWEKVGGYDEKYDPWGSNSDSDLQYKLEIVGVTPKRNRGMLVYHFSNKSGTFDGTHQDFWNQNWNYFIEKWGFPREDTVWYHDLHIPMNQLRYRPPWSRYV